ncbi:hypothetical protein OUZ56_011058 [Daphnia magna]|uniref:HAT C-terminal dimerisation domain-containing protein n=1 Tax=Daphnia magna TaxID=35525 RepID=A0ABQ9YZ50_9CRUS|nr:hypothetical protein OUZ56_011058 [Daphnia magna]
MEVVAAIFSQSRNGRQMKNSIDKRVDGLLKDIKLYYEKPVFQPMGERLVVYNALELNNESESTYLWMLEKSKTFQSVSTILPISMICRSKRLWTFVGYFRRTFDIAKKSRANALTWINILRPCLVIRRASLFSTLHMNNLQPKNAEDDLCNLIKAILAQHRLFSAK